MPFRGFSKEKTLSRSFPLLAACLSACGGSGGTTPVFAPITWQLTAGASAQLEAYQGTQFYPASITIDAGDSVQWTFPTGEPHTVAS